MSTSTSTTPGIKLSFEDRATLVRMLAKYPELSIGQIRDKFQDATGRAISYSSIQKARTQGYKERPGRWHLTPAESQVLLGLVTDPANASMTAMRLVEIFRERAGRTLRGEVVNQLRRSLSLPVLRQGRPRKGVGH